MRNSQIYNCSGEQLTEDICVSCAGELRGAVKFLGVFASRRKA